MKKLLSLLVVLTLLLACLPAGVLAADNGEIPVTLDYSGLTISAVFRESDFARSAYEYNHDLAWLTLCLELSAYSAETRISWGEDGADDSDIAARRSANVAKAYAQLGFDRVDYYNYGVSLNESSDKVAYSIGQKTLGDGSTLVTAFIRGGGYGGEWASNFNLTDDAMAQGYHAGFSAAADGVLEQLKETLGGIAGPVKLWITGYSRGAATANLLAGKLDDYALTTDSLSPENIFTYTYATPCGVLPVRDPAAEVYGNIFNIVNPGDLVTMVAPAAWGYGRYGVTKAFDVNASAAVLQSVDQVWNRYWDELPADENDGDNFKGEFTGADTAKNLQAAQMFQKVMETLAENYPTEESARTLMNFIREMLQLGNLKTLQDGVWKPAGTEEWLGILNEKYGEENVAAAYEAVEAMVAGEPFRSLDEVLGTLGLGGTLTMLLTVGTLNGVEMQEVMVMILKVLLADAEEFKMILTMVEGYLANIQWSDWLAGSGLEGSMGDTIGTFIKSRMALPDYAQTFREQVIFGHLPETYMAWLSQPEQDAFGGGKSASDPAAEGASSWAVKEIQTALSLGLVPEELQGDYKSPVSREAVSGMFVRLLEAAAGKSIDVLLEERGLALNYDAFTDTQNGNVLAMNALGIINGVGDGLFNPEGTLTRAQIAAILNRIARLLGVDTEGYTHSFTDVAGTWVDKELGWPSGAGIINGVGEGRFDPNGLLTREQAIAICLRGLNALTEG